MSYYFYCPKHWGSTMNAVNDFVRQSSFVDVKLVCKNKKTVYSHKLILVSASPFLKAVIEEMNNFEDIATVVLPDFDCNIVTLLLTFLCEGIMKLTKKELGEFRDLCNGLGMTFPGADVVEILNESHHSQSSVIQHSDDLGAAQSSSCVSSREVLHTPSKVDDTANIECALASIVPKIEDCEECQNMDLVEPVPGNDFENTNQMLNIDSIQSLTGSDFSLPEKHRQMSIATGESVMFSDATSNAESWRKVKCSSSDTATDLNMWHATSVSEQELARNSEMSRMHPTPLEPVPAEQNSSYNTNSQFADQKSTSQKMVKQSKFALEKSCNGGDTKSVPLISMSAEQVHFYINNAGSFDGISSSSQKALSQNHEMSSISSVPISFDQDNFHSNNSHFARKKTTTQQMVRKLKGKTETSHIVGDMTVALTPLSAEQIAFLQMKKQSKAKMKKVHNGAGAEKKHLSQILSLSSAHNKLPEQTVVISHKTKQSPRSKSSSDRSDSKLYSKTQPVEKSVQPKKRKKSEGTVR